MPFAEKRNLTISSVCRRPDCGTIFHPFRGREAAQYYCSRACSRAAGVFAKTGHWPDADATPDATPALALAPAPAASASASATSMERQMALFHLACETAARQDTAADKTLATDARRSGQGRTLVIAGQGSYVGVEHGALVVKQGRTHGAPGTREVLHPALHAVARILWLDGAGTLTVAALAWCQCEGVSLTVLDASGRLLAQTCPDAPANAALRRAQYTARDAGRDVFLARHLLIHKLIGQQSALLRSQALLAQANADGVTRAQEAFRVALEWLQLPTPTPFLSRLDGLRAFEARAARAYFAALEAFPLRWHSADLRAGKVPDHWRTLGPRTSPLAPNGNGRNAVRPGQAVLNLAYGALASDIRAALLAEGLDVAAGFLHADKPGRESLVWDMVELRRGDVDALALAFLRANRLQARNIERQPDGSCRLTPGLARLVLASCRASRTDIRDDAHWLVSMLSS